MTDGLYEMARSAALQELHGTIAEFAVVVGEFVDKTLVRRGLQPYVSTDLYYTSPHSLARALEPEPGSEPRLELYVHAFRPARMSEQEFSDQFHEAIHLALTGLIEDHEVLKIPYREQITRAFNADETDDKAYHDYSEYVCRFRLRLAT